MEMPMDIRSMPTWTRRGPVEAALALFECGEISRGKALELIHEIVDPSFRPETPLPPMSACWEKLNFA